MDVYHEERKKQTGRPEFSIHVRSGHNRAITLDLLIQAYRPIYIGL